MHLYLCVWINLYNDIFRFQCRRSLIFQTMSSVRSNNISLKYQRFTTLGFQDIGIRKSEFVSKNQLLWKSINWYKVAISRKQKSIVSLIRKSLIFNKNCKVRPMLVFNFWFFFTNWVFFIFIFITKELILCHKLRFSNPYIFAIKHRIDLRHFNLWILLEQIT